MGSSRALHLPECSVLGTERGLNQGWITFPMFREHLRLPGLWRRRSEEPKRPPAGTADPSFARLWSPGDLLGPRALLPEPKWGQHTVTKPAVAVDGRKGYTHE